MEAYTRLEFKNLCRLCISFSQSSQNIFEKTKAPSSITSKILDCLSIKVEENGPLPKKICKTCLDKLESFSEFKAACINSESTLQCYYSLFKNTIDYDGTIFVKSSEVGIPEQILLDNVTKSSKIDLEVVDIVPENINEVCSTRADESNLPLDPMNDVLIPPSFPSNASSEQIIEVSGSTTLRALDSLHQSSSLAFSDSNEMLISEQINEISRLPLTADNENIIVLDINKCNILDFIDPNAAIYVVNTGTKSDDNNVQELLQLNGSGTTIDSELSKELSKPNISEDNISNPVLDQQGIDKISEFLNNIYPEQKSNSNALQSTEAHQNGTIDSLDIITLGKGIPNNNNVLKGAPDDLILVAPKSIVSDNPILKLEPEEGRNEEQLIDDPVESANINKNAISCSVSNQPQLKPSTPITPQKRVVDSFASAIPLVMKQLDQALKSKTKASIKDIKSSILSSKHECTKCKKCFKSLKTFHKHLAIHYVSQKTTTPKMAPDTEINRCDTCQKTFNCKRTLVTHMRIHQVADGRSRVYKCQQCNKSYGRNWHLNRHIGTAHNPQLSKKELVCHICAKKFNRKENLREHVLRHNKMNSCITCGVVYQNESALRHHKTIGCSVKTICDKCGAEFDSKTCYLQHINSNCGQDVIIKSNPQEKHFSCNLCSMTFKENYKLKLHIQQHKRVVDINKDNYFSGVVNIKIKPEKPGVKWTLDCNSSPNPVNKNISDEVNPMQQLPEIQNTNKCREISSNLCSNLKIQPEKSTDFSLAVATLPDLNKSLEKSSPECNLSVTSSADSNNSKEKTLPQSNLNDLLSNMAKKPLHRKSILTLLGKYLKPTIDNVPSLSKMLPTQNIVLPKSLEKTLALTICAAEKPNSYSSLSEDIKRYYKSNSNDKEASTLKNKETCVPTKVKCTSDKCITERTVLSETTVIRNETARVEELLQKNTLNLDNPSTSLIKTSLAADELHLPFLGNPSPIMTNLQSLKNCTASDKNICQFPFDYQTNTFSNQEPQCKKNVSSLYLNKLPNEEKVKIDIDKKVTYKVYSNLDEPPCNKANSDNMHIQTSDLALSINDKLPDTLLTLQPNFERAPKNVSEKSISFIEGSTNTFAVESFEHLISASEPNFESELDTLIKEAVQTFDECPAGTYSLMPDSNCTSENSIQHVNIISNKMNSIGSISYQPIEVELNKELEVSNNSGDEGSEDPPVQNNPLTVRTECQNEYNKSFTEEIKYNALNNLEDEKMKETSNVCNDVQTCQKKSSGTDLVTSFISEENFRKIESKQDGASDDELIKSLKRNENEPMKITKSNEKLNSNLLQNTLYPQTENIMNTDMKDNEILTKAVKNTRKKELLKNRINCSEDSKLERNEEYILQMNSKALGLPQTYEYTRNCNVPNQTKEKLNLSAENFSNLKMNSSNQLDHTDLKDKEFTVEDKDVIYKNNTFMKLQSDFNGEENKSSQLSTSYSETNKTNTLTRVTDSYDSNDNDDNFEYDQDNVSKRFSEEDINSNQPDQTPENKIEANMKENITKKDNQFNSVRPSEGYVVLSNKRTHNQDKKYKRENWENRQQLSPKKEYNHKENKSDLGKINTTVKRIKLNKDCNSEVYKLKECSIKIELCNSLIPGNSDLNKITNDSKENSGENINLGQIETSIDNLRTNDLVPEQSTIAGSTIDNSLLGSSEESTKQPIRTIRILLERFDPHKIAQYSNKDLTANKSHNIFQTQPYNLRKSKDVQTYICTMEDS